MKRRDREISSRREIDEIIRACVNGVRAVDARELMEAFDQDLDLREMRRLFDHGISGTYAREMRETWPEDLSAKELIRLFNNLVSNAIKYNRDGGSVTLTAERDGPYVKASVSDTGVGISQEGVSKLFNEFFREKTTATKHVTGTGLGLSIVKSIVERHGGEIEIESTIGEGTTFTVWLPR